MSFNYKGWTWPALLMTTTLALLFATALYFFQSDDPAKTSNLVPKTGTSVPVLGTYASRDGERLAASQSDTLSSSGSNPLRTTNLLDKFTKMIDGRQFVLEAWAFPEKGGYLYGSHVADRCKFVSSFTDLNSQSQPPTPPASSDHVKVITAFDRLKRLCGQFTEAELADHSGLTAMVSTNRDKDILLKALGDLSTATRLHDEAGRRKAISNILIIGDPLLIDKVGMRLSISSDEAGSYLYFEGKKLRINSEPALASAFYLIPCGMGMDCSGSNDIDLLIQCANAFTCYSDRFAKIRAVDAGGDPVRYQAILNAYSALLGAVKAHDASKFSP